MSWRFPRFRLRDGNALSTDDTNESFLESADEMSGRLNEHNWASGSIPARTDVQASGVFRWHHAFVEANFVGFPPTIPPWNVISPNSGWVQLDGMSLTITGPGGMLWVHACATWSTYPSGVNPAPFIRWALRLNGQIIPETILGGLEEDNSSLNVAASSGTGLNLYYWPAVTSAVLTIPPGPNTIEFCARLDTNPGITTEELFFVNRELICLEMRR